MKKISYLLLVCFILMIASTIYLKKDRNELTIYTTQESEDIDYLIGGFKKEYPEIKLNIIKGSTGTITAKLLLEKGNPQADVIWNLDATSALTLEKYNILAQYKPKGIENIDSKFYDTKNNIPRWTGTTIETAVMIVNKEEAKKKKIPIPKGFDDLVDSVYKNQIVMPDPISSGTGYLVINSWLQNKGEKNGWNFISDINKNMKLYTSSGSAPAKSTGIGEQVVGITFDKSSIRVAKNVPEVETIFPNGGSPWTVNVIALVNKKEIKPSAKKFYDWAISINTMKKYGDIRLLTSLKNSKPSKDIPDNFKEMLGKNNLHWAADNKEIISNEWKSKFDCK